MKVHQYGLLPPHPDDAARVREQMSLAHRYRNSLVEIERKRRAAMRAMLSERGDLSSEEQAEKSAHDALDTAIGAVKTARAATRSRSDTAEMRAAVALARAAHRAAVGALRARRAALRDDPAIEAERERIEAEAQAAVKAVRNSEAAPYWGTYLLVEDAMGDSRAMPLYDGAEPNDPRFVRWSGEGAVSVQLQGGLSVADVFGDDTRVRVVRGTPKPRRDGKPRQPGKKDHRELWLRVGSDGRDPVWARWTMILHRPLPAGGTIKRVTVSLRRYGPREEWTAQFSVSEPTEDRACGRGAVAIDLGWRVVQDGIRVATWAGDDGRSGTLVIPARAGALGAIAKAEELRSLRDGKFNGARVAIGAHLAAIPVLPEWLAEAIKTLPQWRSPARLVALWRRWAAARFDGDAGAFAALAAWRERDHHLWHWESGARRAGLRHRREAYRVFAAELARSYAVVVLEQFDLRRVARAKPTEEAKADNEAARANRQRTAVSELRLCLVQAFEGRGGDAPELDAVNTTRECHACHVVATFDAATYIHHACAACGVVWDQDENACRNLIERWRAEESAWRARKEEKAKEVASKPGTAWARAKAAKAERLAAKGAARNGLPDAKGCGTPSRSRQWVRPT